MRRLTLALALLLLLPIVAHAKVDTLATTISYTGTGAQTSFPIPFAFAEATTIGLTVDNIPQSYGSAYSVTKNVGVVGGTLTTVAAPVNGALVVLTRLTAKTQGTHFTPNAAFPAAAAEAALDRLTLIAQETAAGTGGGGTPTPADLPFVDARAFGVVCDNLTTSAAANVIAVQAAVNAVSIHGGLLWIACNGIHLNAAIAIGRPLIMQGPGSTDVSTPGLTTFILDTAGQTGFVISGKAPVVFRDLSVKGTTTTTNMVVNGPTGPLKGTEQFRLDNVLHVGGAVQLDVQAGIFWRVTNSTFWNYDVAGVRVANILDNDQGDSLIDGAVFNGQSGAFGVLYESGGGLKVTNSKFLFGATCIALDLAGTTTLTSDLKITGNSCENFTGAGIVVTRSAGNVTALHIQISDNQIASYQGGASIGVQVEPAVGAADVASAVVLSNNLINNVTTAIRTRQINVATFVGNTLQAPTIYDLGLTSQNVRISGDYAYDFTTLGATGAVLQGGKFSLAQLPAAADGSFVVCADCTTSTPCASGGDGRLALRRSGVWACEGGGGGGGTGTVTHTGALAANAFALGNGGDDLKPQAITGYVKGAGASAPSGVATIPNTDGGTGQNSSAWTALPLVTAGVWGVYGGSGACAAGDFISAISAAGVKTCATPAGGGNVNAAGTLTDRHLVLGTGSTSVDVVASLGTVATVLHGNAAGPPSFGAVSLTADVSGVLPLANGGTGLSAAADDTVMVSNGTVWQAKVLTVCTGASKALTYDTATNAFGCNTITGGSGGTPAGTAGQVQFNNTPAGTFQADPNLFWDNTAKRLGVRTSTPLVTLDVQGLATISANAGALPASATSTVLQVAGVDASAAYVTLDVFGAGVPAAFQGRNARGTAASPTPSLLNDQLVALVGLGRGTTGYSSTARGSLGIYAGGTWSDTSQPTFFTFATTPTGSTTLTERVRILADGSVGIATTTPTRTVQIQGDFSVGSSPTNPGVLLHTNGVNGDIVGLNNTGAAFNGLSFSTGVSPSLFLTTAGRVGLGTATPAVDLHVQGATNTTTAVQVSNSTAGAATVAASAVVADAATLTLQAHASARVISHFGQVVGGWGELLLTPGSGLMIGTGNATPLIVGTNNAERMRLSAAGDLGVGTTAPQVRLDVSINASALPTAPSGTAARFTGTTGFQANVIAEAFGAVQGAFIGRSANGTPTARTAKLANQALVALTGRGAYDATNYSSDQASFGCFAAENWSVSAQGTFCTVGITVPGTTTLVESTRFTGTGVGINATAPTARLAIDGNGASDTTSLYVNGGNGTPSTLEVGGLGIRGSRFAGTSSWITTEALTPGTCPPLPCKWIYHNIFYGTKSGGNGNRGVAKFHMNVNSGESAATYGAVDAHLFTSAPGSFIALNPYVLATTGATNLTNLYGMEVDVDAGGWFTAANGGNPATVTVGHKVGLQIVEVETSKAIVTGESIALLLRSQNGAIGFNYGLVFHTDVPSVKTSGTLISTHLGGTYAIGMDLFGTTFNNGDLRLSSGAYILGGAAGGGLRFLNSSSGTMLTMAEVTGGAGYRVQMAPANAGPSYTNSRPFYLNATTSGTKTATVTPTTYLEVLQGINYPGVYVINNDSSIAADSNLGYKQNVAALFGTVETAGFYGAGTGLAGVYYATTSPGANGGNAQERVALSGSLFATAAGNYSGYGVNGFAGRTAVTNLLVSGLFEINNATATATGVWGVMSHNIHNAFATTQIGHAAYMAILRSGTLGGTRTDIEAWQYAFMASTDGTTAGARFSVLNDGSQFMNVPSTGATTILDLRRNSVIQFQVDNATSATDLGVLVNYNGTLKRALVGAADSCGAGFRCLRITN